MDVIPLKEISLDEETTWIGYTECFLGEERFSVSLPDKAPKIAIPRLNVLKHKPVLRIINKLGNITFQRSDLFFKLIRGVHEKAENIWFLQMRTEIKEKLWSIMRFPLKRCPCIFRIKPCSRRY